MISITLNIDGVDHPLSVPAGATLLEVLRAERVTVVKDGCSTGDCGSCAVLLDGRVVNACFVLAGHADGAKVATVAGLASAQGDLHPLQRAFLDAGAVQCGFCTPGMLMAAVDLMARIPHPSERDVRTALAGTMCRCTGFVKPIEAILQVTARENDDG